MYIFFAVLVIMALVAYPRVIAGKTETGNTRLWMILAG
jgi:hypothetical protein